MKLSCLVSFGLVALSFVLVGCRDARNAAEGCRVESLPGGGVAVVGPAMPLNMDNPNNRAMDLYQEGRYQEAEAILREHIASVRAKFGNDVQACDRHHLGFMLPNLAAVLNKLGRVEEAEVAYKEGLSLQLDVLGSDHCSYVRNQQYLARFYREHGQYEKADALFQQVLSALRKPLEGDGGGYQRKVVEESIKDYADMLAEQGRITDLRAFLNQAISLSLCAPARS